MILLFLSMAFASSVSEAADFEILRDRIANREKAIDAEMNRLGVYSKIQSPYLQNNESEKEQLNRSLYKVHSSGTTQSVPSGTLLFGRTINRLVVGAEESPVVVEIEVARRFGILNGLRVIGVAHQGGTPGRINLKFDRLILRSGKSVTIAGTGLDEAGAFGLQAEVYSSKALKAVGAMAGSFISGYAASQQTQSVNDFGFSQTNATGRNSLLQGVAQTAADQAQKFIESETEEKPVLVLDSGAEITIFLNSEVKL